MDGTYQDYINRVARLTLAETYQSQLEHIQESPKFKQIDGKRVATPFPGYTIITPPWGEESANGELYQNLQECQQKLLERLEDDVLVPVPPDSFHLTLADLIWDGTYREAATNPEFEEKLRSRIAESFSACSKSPSPIRWMVLGLMVFTRALGVCLAPTDENSYTQILELRRGIYQNPDLIALGIEQQYYLTAHITLGYFGGIKPGLGRDRLSKTLSELNDQWLQAPQELWVQRAELRKFDDMTNYYREPDWPVFEF